jgi:hypothetical protein
MIFRYFVIIMKLSVLIIRALYFLPPAAVREYLLDREPYYSGPSGAVLIVARHTLKQMLQ